MLLGAAQEPKQASEEPHDIAHCHCVGTPCRRTRENIRGRRRAGELITSLADDYDLPVAKILTILARKT